MKPDRILGALLLAGFAFGTAYAQDAAPKKPEPTYIGTAKCKMCHLKEHKTWAASKHAVALSVLKPEEAAKAECIGCHVTGFVAGETVKFAEENVGCEACHGPGSLYGAKEVMAKAKYKENPEAAVKLWRELGLVKPTEATCKGCHNEKSPSFKGFDFAKASATIKHWDDAAPAAPAAGAK